MNPQLYTQMLQAQDPLAAQQQQRGFSVPPPQMASAPAPGQQGMGLFGGGMTSDEASKYIMQAAMMAGGM